MGIVNIKIVSRLYPKQTLWVSGWCGIILEYGVAGWGKNFTEKLEK